VPQVQAHKVPQALQEHKEQQVHKVPQALQEHKVQ
jgi:hypothetical protein